MSLVKSLIFLAVLLGLAALLLRRKRSTSSTRVEIGITQVVPLSARSKLVLISYAGRSHLLGVCDGGISVIAQHEECDPKEVFEEVSCELN